MSQVRRAVSTGKWDELPHFKHVKDEITLIGCLLLRGQRIIIPNSLRKQILDLVHEGHQGIVKCKSRLREKVWWPGRDKEVEHYVKTCKACLLTLSRPLDVPVRRIYVCRIAPLDVPVHRLKYRCPKCHCRYLVIMISFFFLLWF